MQPQQTNQTKWWEAEGRDAAMRAVAMISQINTAQIGFHQDNLRHLRMYENRDYLAAAVSSYMVKTYAPTRRTGGNRTSNRMALNVSKACIDTLVSKLGKERVKPTYLTNGGLIERRSRVQKLNDWLYGEFYRTGIYDWNKSVLRNAAIFGKGGIKIFIRTKDNGKHEVAAEPVFMPEILIDPYDGYYGNPSCLYQQKFVTKDTLRNNKFFASASAQAAIDLSMSVSSISGVTAHDSTVVWEAWRKKQDGKPGKHIIFLDSGMLWEEDWDDCEFSMDFLDYTTPPIGFFGLGVCEELIPIQVEINRLANHIRDSLILCANPRTYIPAGANIMKPLSNQIGGEWVYHGGQPPTTVAPQAVSQDTFAQLENLYRKAFEIVGLSQMSATGRNTLGASASGEAIRQYVDVETDRFAELQQNWEDFHVRMARKMHNMARKIVEMDGSYPVTCYDLDGKRNTGVWEIDFKDIDVPEDSYTIQCFPQSALPKLPGPRLATIKEWKDEGYIEKDQAREMMDFPDLKGQMQYILAPRRVIERALEEMAYQPKPQGTTKWKSVTPEPNMDLAYGMQMGSAMYNFLLLELPEDTDEERKEKGIRLDLIRQWINKCDALGKLKAQTMTPPAPGMSPGMAQTSPMGPDGAPVGMPQQALGAPGMTM